MFISLWYSKAVKRWKKSLHFIYVNETFFKAKCSTSSFYIAACNKSTSENNPFSNFLWLFLNYLPCKAKSNIGSTLLFFVFKHLISVIVKNKTFMNILVRNAENQILKLSKFIYFQILFTVPKLFPLKNVIALFVEWVNICFGFSMDVTRL